MGRIVVVVQTLDPDEATFPFEQSVRLRALEGEHLVESDEEAREGYLAALEAERVKWEESLISRGGRLVRARTDDDPVMTVRAIAQAVQRGAA